MLTPDTVTETITSAAKLAIIGLRSIFDLLEELRHANIIEGNLQAEGKKFALIVSRFNDFITDKLVGGAIDALVRSGARRQRYRYRQSARRF